LFSIPHCFKQSLLLGLDISQSHVRMVALSQARDGRFSLEAHGQLTLPAGLVSDQHVHHPGQLAEYIAMLAKQCGSKRKRVAFALPANTVITRDMQVPSLASESTLNALIATEAGGYLGVPADQVRVDYQFSESLCGDPAHRNVVLAAARREQVEDRIAAVEAAGLIPLVLGIDLYSAHAACLLALQHSAPMALLIPGGTQMQIALFDSHRMLYHRELPGCDGITDLLRTAVAATRAIRLATPTGTSITHIFVGSDRAGNAALLCRLVQAECDGSGQSANCHVADPLSAIQREACNNTSTSDEEQGANGAERPGDNSAYLTAFGLAMRSAP
jgi:type IV pilus assembly protein PilM